MNDDHVLKEISNKKFILNKQQHHEFTKTFTAEIHLLNELHKHEEKKKFGKTSNEQVLNKHEHTNTAKINYQPKYKSNKSGNKLNFGKLTWKKFRPSSLLEQKHQQKQHKKISKLSNQENTRGLPVRPVPAKPFVEEQEFVKSLPDNVKSARNDNHIVNTETNTTEQLIDENDELNDNRDIQLPFELSNPPNPPFQKSIRITRLLAKQRKKHLAAVKDYKELKSIIYKEMQTEISLCTKSLADQIEQSDKNLEQILERLTQLSYKVILCTCSV